VTEPSKHNGIPREKDALQSAEDELQSLRKENEEMSEEYEAFAAKINQLTVEAEIARLEFDQIFNAVGDPIWVVDNKNKVLRINNALVDLLELESKKAAVGKKCYDLLPSDLCLTPNCPLQQIVKGAQRVELDVDFDFNRQSKVPFWVTGTPLYGLARETIGAVIQYKDITERKRNEEALKRANRKLEKLATIDGLTQLANRRTFDITLEKEWRRMRRSRQPLSVILSDIDYFKRFNDHYGHQEGDDCLKAVAGGIKNCLHRPADLAARYGGEEFVVVLPNTPSDGAKYVAETIRAAIAALQYAHARSEVEAFVTLSLGVATIVPSSEDADAEDLVKMADKALYESKEAGRNLVTVKNRS